MRAFMQAEIARQEAESQEEIRQKEEQASEVRRLHAEVTQGRLLPIVFKNTEAQSIGQVPSNYAESTQPSTPTLKSKVQNSSKTFVGT